MILCLELSGICSLTIKKSHQSNQVAPEPTLEKDYNGEIKVNTSSAEEALINKVRNEKNPIAAQQAYEKLVEHNDAQEKYILEVELENKKKEINEKIEATVNKVKEKADDAVSDLKKNHLDQTQKVTKIHEQQIANAEVEIRNEKLTRLKEIRAEFEADIEANKEEKNELSSEVSDSKYDSLGELQVDTAESIGDLLAESEDRKQDILSEKVDSIEELTNEKDDKAKSLADINLEEENVGTNYLVEIEQQINSKDLDVSNNDLSSTFDIEDDESQDLELDGSSDSETETTNELITDYTEGESFNSESIIEDIDNFEAETFDESSQSTVDYNSNFTYDSDSAIATNDSIIEADEEETTACTAKLTNLESQISEVSKRINNLLNSKK